LKQGRKKKELLVLIKSQCRKRTERQKAFRRNENLLPMQKMMIGICLAWKEANKRMMAIIPPPASSTNETPDTPDVKSLNPSKPLLSNLQKT
jgi:hypothetical protein